MNKLIRILIIAFMFSLTAYCGITTCFSYVENRKLNEELKSLRSEYEQKTNIYDDLNNKLLDLDTKIELYRQENDVSMFELWKKKLEDLKGSIE